MGKTLNLGRYLALLIHTSFLHLPKPTYLCKEKHVLSQNHLLFFRSEKQLTLPTSSNYANPEHYNNYVVWSKKVFHLKFFYQIFISHFCVSYSNNVMSFHLISYTSKTVYTSRISRMIFEINRQSIKSSDIQIIV